MLDKRKLFVVVCVLSSSWASVKPILKEEIPKNKEISTPSNANGNVVGANDVQAQIDSKPLAPAADELVLNSENKIVNDSTDNKANIIEEETRKVRPKPHSSNLNNLAISTANGASDKEKEKPQKPERPNATHSGQGGKPNHGKPNHGKPNNNEQIQPNNEQSQSNNAQSQASSEQSKPGGKPNKPGSGISQISSKPNKPNSQAPSKPSSTNANAAPGQGTEAQPSHEKLQKPADKEVHVQSTIANNEDSQSNQNSNGNSGNSETLNQNSIPAAPGTLPSPPKGSEPNDNKNVLIETNNPSQVDAIKPTGLWGLPLLNFGLVKPKENAIEDNNEEKENNSESEITAASKIEAQIQQIKYQVIQALNSSTNSLLATEKISVDNIKPEDTSDKVNQPASLTEEQVQSILSAFANHTEAIKLSLQQTVNSTQSQNNKNEVSSTEQLEVQESSITVPVENLAQPEVYYEVEEIVDEPAASNVNGNPSLQAAQNLIAQIGTGSSSQFSSSGTGAGGALSRPPVSGIGAGAASGIGAGAASSHLPVGNSGGASSEFAASSGIGAGGAASQHPVSGNAGGTSAQQPGQAVSLPSLVQHIVLAAIQGSGGQQQQQQPTYTLENNGNFDPNMQMQMQQQSQMISNVVSNLMQIYLQQMQVASQSYQPLFLSHSSGALPISAASSVGQASVLPSGETHHGLSAASVMGSSQSAGGPSVNYLHPANSNFAFAAVYPPAVSSMQPDLTASTHPNPIIPETENRPAGLTEEENNPSPIGLTAASEEDTFAEEVQTVPVDSIDKNNLNNVISIEKMHRPNYNNRPQVANISTPVVSENELFDDRDKPGSNKPPSGSGKPPAGSGTQQSNQSGKPPAGSGTQQSNQSGKPEKPNSHGKPNQQSSQSVQNQLIHIEEDQGSSNFQLDNKPQQISQHLPIQSGEITSFSPSKPDKPPRPQNSHLQQNQNSHQIQQNQNSHLQQNQNSHQIQQNQNSHQIQQNQNFQVQQNSQNFLNLSEENTIFDKPSSSLISQVQQNSQNILAQSDENALLNKPEAPSTPVNPSIVENAQSSQQNLQAANQQLLSQPAIEIQKPNAPQVEVPAQENMQTVVQVVVSTRPRPGGKPNRPHGEAGDLANSKPFGIGKPHDKPGKGKHSSNSSIKIEEGIKAENASQTESDIKTTQQESGNSQDLISVTGIVTQQSENANRVVASGNSYGEAKPAENTPDKPLVITKPESISKPINNKKPKPKPGQGKPDPHNKPKPQFGFGFGKRKPANKEGAANETNNGAVPGPPKPKPNSWHLPKWPSFAQLYQNIFGARQRTDDEEFEENREAACVPPTVNLRDKQDDRPLCGANQSKDEFTCEKLCRDSGFNVGTCLEDNSCICSYSESSEAGLRMEYYYDRNMTNWEDYYPSYDSCTRCSCSNLCTETGYFLGVCANTCYCARPFFNGVPLDLYPNSEQKSK